MNDSADLAFARFDETFRVSIIVRAILIIANDEWFIARKQKNQVSEERGILARGKMRNEITRCSVLRYTMYAMRFFHPRINRYRASGIITGTRLIK